MNHLPTIVTLSLLALPGLCLAQGEAKETPKAQQSDKTAAHWIEQLGSDSYRARLEAETALKEQGEKSLQALKDAAENSKDPEVQWRARRLVRQIERGDQGLQQRPQDPAPQTAPQTAPQPAPGRFQRRPFQGMSDLDSRFDELFRELERDFQMDIPRGRFFQDDFFKDLRTQLDEMRKGMGQGLPGFRSQGMTMQMGPDGVRVEMKVKNDKGEDETKVYEAPDMETFRQKYPGVLEQNGIGGMQGFNFRLGNPGGGWRALPMPGQPRGQDVEPDVWTPVPQGGEAVTPPENVRLGVQVKQEIDPSVRAFLELPEGKGLQIDVVQPDTLAERLGLKTGDIVLQIAGRDIGAIPDVQEALRPIEGGKPVKVVINRRGKELTLTADKAAEAKDSGKLELRKEKKDKKQGSEIR